MQRVVWFLPVCRFRSTVATIVAYVLPVPPSDALWYGSTEYKPTTIIDVATLTGAMDIALGEIFTGVFTNSDDLWTTLHAAGEREHDRFWRMPLSDDYAPQIERSNADLCNVRSSLLHAVPSGN
eukprot:GHVU01075820.1.p1 GENE.GHVU01075820.1~~GHVU01075820.1.p1  ORF type:complete len:124 (+),score=8.21 GHVU01075820.1:26-397(+)